MVVNCVSYISLALTHSDKFLSTHSSNDCSEKKRNVAINSGTECELGLNKDVEIGSTDYQARPTLRYLMAVSYYFANRK